ncbi:unnamed protein product [Rhodiola kirilowii]
MKEVYVVKKLLCAVPGKYLQIVSTIEQFGDMKTMSVEEVIDRLKAYEERLHGVGDTEVGHVFLSRTNWKPRESRNEGESSNRGPGNFGDRGRGGGRGRVRGRGRTGDDRVNNPDMDFKFDIKKVRCFSCNNYGHYSSDCQLKKKDEKAHFAKKI